MKQYFGIISRAKLWIALGVLAMIGAAALFITNVRYSIQFTGGVEFLVDTPELSDGVITVIEDSLTDAGYKDFVLGIGKRDDYASVLIQARLNNEEATSIRSLTESILKEQGVISSDEGVLEFTMIGPSFGDYIKKSAKSALITGTILMAIYILFAFAGMRELVSPLMLGIITVVTMLFDVSLPSGAYGMMMGFNSAVQVDTVFIIALLTVMGYSVNDTIVIFDRVRENFAEKKSALEKGTITGEDIFEISIWQTMKRSIGTSLSTLVVVIAMFLFGTGVLKTFAFTLGVGVLAGTYSSIFLAAPLAFLASAKKFELKK